MMILVSHGNSKNRQLYTIQQFFLFLFFFQGWREKAEAEDESGGDGSSSAPSSSPLPPFTSSSAVAAAPAPAPAPAVLAAALFFALSTPSWTTACAEFITRGPTSITEKSSREDEENAASTPEATAEMGPRSARTEKPQQSLAATTAAVHSASCGRKRSRLGRGAVVPAAGDGGREARREGGRLFGPWERRRRRRWRAARRAARPSPLGVPPAHLAAAATAAPWSRIASAEPATVSTEKSTRYQPHSLGCCRRSESCCFRAPPRGLARCRGRCCGDRKGEPREVRRAGADKLLRDVEEEDGPVPPGPLPCPAEEQSGEYDQR